MQWRCRLLHGEYNNNLFREIMDINQKIRLDHVRGRVKDVSGFVDDEERLKFNNDLSFAFIPQDVNIRTGTVGHALDRITFLPYYWGQKCDWGTALYVIDTLTHSIIGGYFSQNWDSN